MYSSVFFKSFTYKWQHCQNNPNSHAFAKWLKTLYFACQASCWWCHFVKKYYASAHICIPINWTRNTVPMHMTSPFSQIQVVVVFRDDNGIIFKNLHFETYTLDFQAPKTTLLCKWTNKWISIFSSVL